MLKERAQIGKITRSNHFFGTQLSEKLVFWTTFKNSVTEPLKQKLQAWKWIMSRKCSTKCLSKLKIAERRKGEEITWCENRGLSLRRELFNWRVAAMRMRELLPYWCGQAISKREIRKMKTPRFKNGADYFGLCNPAFFQAILISYFPFYLLFSVFICIFNLLQFLFASTKYSIKTLNVRFFLTHHPLHIWCIRQSFSKHGKA